MGRNSAFSKEFSGELEGEDLDPEDDAMPIEVLVLGRDIEVESDGRTVRLEAHITKHNGQADGVTWVKMFEKGCPEKFTHCYIDTIDGELILDAIENYVRQGKGPKVAQFIREEGKSIRNPVTFRIKLDSALGSGSLQAEAADMF